jgi:3'-5' exoribonuclease
VAKPFVQEILPNMEVAGAFVVTDKQLRTARNGMPFLTLKLADKTGEMTARIWERAVESAECILKNSVVFVRGRSEVFRDELQLHIQEVVPLPRKDFDPSDFLPVCPHDTRVLLDKLQRMASSVKRRSLQRLLKHILQDAELMGRFTVAPAAKSMHHAYLGGLLEHTVSVTVLVSEISSLYPELDRDLLIVGAILHDIGKIHEFAYDVCIDYSDAGRLLGHMVLGVEILENKLRGLRNFPLEDALLLKHLILSHHGETEYGAVRLPMTREAFALHLADDLDAKMNGINRILSESSGANEAWTAYQSMYDRFFFRGLPRAEEEPASPAAEPAADRGVQLNIWASKNLKKSGP